MFEIYDEPDKLKYLKISNFLWNDFPKDTKIVFLSTEESPIRWVKNIDIELLTSPHLSDESKIEIKVLKNRQFGNIGSSK